MPSVVSTIVRLHAPLFSRRPRSLWRSPLAYSLLSLLLAASAGASLRVADSAPHARLWRRIYDDLPDAWKTSHVILVQEVSDAEMENLLRSLGPQDAENLSGKDAIVDGCYEGGEADDDPATITLRETLQGEDAALVFAHEYGHFVWEEKLTDAQRARYKRLWKEQRRANHLITAYAATAEDEGFAEAFAYYLRKSDLLRRRDKESWRFLADLTH